GSLVRGRELGNERGDRAEQLASACGRRRAFALDPAVAKRELESLELRGERLEPQRGRGATQAVCLVGRRRNRGGPVGRTASPVQRVELELDARDAPGGVAQEQGSQLAQGHFGSEIHDIPSS